jgi:hypothetical protein
MNNYTQSNRKNNVKPANSRSVTGNMPDPVIRCEA